jgi:hypothetical protein
MVIWSILWPFGLFCGHLVFFVTIWSILWPFDLFCGHWSILWPFGLFCGHLVYFVAIWYIFPFWYVVRKIWQPLSKAGQPMLVERKNKFDEDLLVMGGSVARFFLVKNTKMGKICQLTMNYTKCP